MAKAKKGDTVRIHYKGTLDDGTEFDNSEGRDPLEFELGSGMVIEGFDKAVMGMKPDESKKFTIPTEEAYGLHNDEKVHVLSFEDFPGYFPKVGEQVEVRDTDDTKVIGTVVEVTEMNITIDANHPLAGQDLTFEVQLVEIV